MVTSISLAAIFLLICTTFGFIYLTKINKINSLIFLAPFSISFGLSFYVFLCHLISFVTGPGNSSVFSLLILFILSIIIFIIKRKKDIKMSFEVSKSQFITLLSLSILISVCIFFAGYRFGMFDEAWHIPLATSIYHNETYPPKDFLRPDYALIYHFGGDLLAGALNHISKIEILTSFEILSGIFSGVTFLSFFSLAWILTRNYSLSLLSAICSFFGAGLTWLNSIISYLISDRSDFWETFLTRGIHGTIIDAPSLIAFSSTSSIGYPVLILCLFLFWNLLHLQGFKSSLPYIISLTISLFSLSLFAGWLSATFLIGTLAYIGILFITSFLKNKQYLNEFTSLNLLYPICLFILLNKLIGNQMYSADQFLGRSNIFNVALKEKLFTVTIWNTFDPAQQLTSIISCFSWQFISAFSLSLFLFPIILIYLKKQKNTFAMLLFLCTALTMPIPLIFEFKLNPVDFNRLFGFGNTMLILLITCGLGLLFNNFIKSKIIVVAYIIFFCLSPLSGFISGVLLSPQIYLHKQFTDLALDKLKDSQSIKDLFKQYVEINKEAFRAKYSFQNKYKNEIAFFNKNGKSNDVAISSIPGIPVYSGIYTLIPSMMYGLKSQIYSSFDNIYPTIISTLDPHLLNEFNIKWVAYDELSKSKLSKETLGFLNNKKIFTLMYKGYIEPGPQEKVLYEIYHVSKLQNCLKEYPRQIGWILVNKEGSPIEILEKLNNSISLFYLEKDALAYLNKLHKEKSDLKNKLITAQPVIIKTTQEQLLQSGLNIKLEERT